MDNIKEQLEKNLKELVKSKFDIDVDVALERPKDESHGDYASNIAMKLAKDLSRNPMEIAEEIINELRVAGYEFIDSVEVARPGFINFKINKDENKKVVDVILEKASEYGKSNYGGGKQVMIEFGQPNTHKAFHVGHLKSAISGLAMVKLHENLGYNVIKANFYGDIGMLVAKTTWGFMHSEIPADLESWDVHTRMKFIDDCYVKGSTAFKDDKAAEEEMRNINKDIYAEKDTEATKIYKQLRIWSLEHQKDVWKNLGIVFDREYPESEIYKDAIAIVEKYKDEVFEKSEGAIIYRGEKVGLTNWVFLTSEGNPTYSAKDLGLAYKKFEEYPDMAKGIVTTSVEIKDYFKVIIHILSIIKPETKDRYFHIPFGWMLRGGRKFSSRMGGSIKGMDILNEVKEMSLKKIDELKEYSNEEKEEIVNAVANAGLKFLVLSHEFHKDFSYDPEQFLSFSGFSGPYILYTYARSKSILRKSEVDYKQTLNSLNSVLNSPYEQDLIKKLEQYPELAERAGIAIEPHLIANYLYELAGEFNQFYKELSVLNAETEADKIARLKLVEATSIVLHNGLGLLGIETVEKM